MHLYPFPVILGVLMACLGVCFNRVLLATMDAFDRLRPVQEKDRMAVPILLALPLAWAAPRVLGSGHHILTDLMSLEWTLGFIVSLLLLKFVYTCVQLRFRRPGQAPSCRCWHWAAWRGRRSVTLFIRWFALPESYMLNMVVYAMLAYFTAIVRAPITGVILITEMTGSFQQFPAAVCGGHRGLFWWRMFWIASRFTTALLKRAAGHTACG